MFPSLLLPKKKTTETLNFFLESNFYGSMLKETIATSFLQLGFRPSPAVQWCWDTAFVIPNTPGKIGSHALCGVEASAGENYLG